ncbi:MAG: HI0074 family nucleotidyltransferase substrate-binding subunit [Nitrospirota bacterium]
MVDELAYGLAKFRAAADRLKESAGRAVDDLDRDGVIKRFEFTFELFWKALKLAVEYEGFDCAGPRSCIKEAVRRGILEDGEEALDMLDDQNKTTHIYSEETAREIFDRIKERHVSLLARAALRLEEKTRPSEGGRG